MAGRRTLELGSGTVVTSRGPGDSEEFERSESKAFRVKSRGLINSCGTAAESGAGRMLAGLRVANH